MNLKRFLASVCASLCLLLGLFANARADPGAIPASISPESQPKAINIARETMQSLGIDKLNEARYLRFDSEVNRNGTMTTMHHLWDRNTGRYRVEWEAENGKPVVALFNVNSQSGTIYIDDERVDEEEAVDEMLRQAQQRFINDSHCLLAPFKLLDVGIKLEWTGAEMIDGVLHDVLHASFKNASFSPGDQYWFYIDEHSGRVDRWAFFPQGYKGKTSLDKATVWDWKDWRSFGKGFWLSLERLKLDKTTALRFPVVAVLDQVSDEVFEDANVDMPEPPLPQVPNTGAKNE